MVHPLLSTIARVVGVEVPQVALGELLYWVPSNLEAPNTRTTHGCHRLGSFLSATNSATGYLKSYGNCKTIAGRSEKYIIEILSFHYASAAYT